MDLKKMAQAALEDKKKGNTLEGLTKFQESKKKRFVAVEELGVDEVYRSLIRQQTPQEEEQLKISIGKEGIRDALVVYEANGNLVVVDGHHRLNMAKELGIATVPVQQMEFGNVDEARIWMLRNQLGRRNLNDAERIEIALQLTAFMEKLGIQNKMKGKNLGANLHKGQQEKKIDRLQEASRIANVSRRNVAKYKKIYEQGGEGARREVVEGKKSIHRAHSEVVSKQKKGRGEAEKSAPVKYNAKVEKVYRKMQDWKAGKISETEMKQLLASCIK